jgi:DNA-binding transcriptional ArsR family regulator
MKSKDAVAALSALAQDTRLVVFRHLMQCLPDGVAAGDLAAKLKVPPSTLSSHLAILGRAGLVTSTREGRTIYFSADQEGIRDLLQFLIKDCCRGKPEICSRLVEVIQPACCP